MNQFLLVSSSGPPAHSITIASPLSPFFYFFIFFILLPHTASHTQVNRQLTYRKGGGHRRRGEGGVKGRW